ncbi:calcineurin-like phosphoesterase family protein [Amycolatopsis bartoniae]|uniref:Serine/threonine protein phosphatase n=1 Tax=Amycolatopsis bartoniae TaxID=941986 RepID=A0A8H9J486_9PSEU|nr:metallophosphoesterase family protein [Amycolatopsis bartoniae]MBB2936348.1 calcineurin-like phosphoesterase family protein [Amycolatopsis bartoniae]TVS99728.1 metallophosphoesterase [Amycolatopsis bartoniae]GHF85143.1 serine/threonine protein phosphatase [Amycolatopsis bartoniae]
MNVWFTADTHFDHQLVAGLRGFGSPAEHDEFVVQRWNATVHPGDQVWHLGDVGMGRLARFAGVLRQLHGELHLVTGNHDEPWPGLRQAYQHQRAWLEHFASVQAFARRRIGGRNVLLSHFPYEGDHTEDDRASQYRLPDEGLPLLHGHVHGAWRRHGRQLNVGLDVSDLRPVHLDEIAAELDRPG